MEEQLQTLDQRSSRFVFVAQAHSLSLTEEGIHRKALYEERRLSDEHD